MSMLNIGNREGRPSNARSALTKIREGDIQPNAVDLRLGKVWEFRAYEGGDQSDNRSQHAFVLDEDHKGHLNRREVMPVFNWYEGHWASSWDDMQDEDGYFAIQPGRSYEIAYENEIEIKTGMAGFCIPRSTLIRNGVFVSGGLYDSGYSGPMGGLIINNSGFPFYVKPGTRIAQFLMFDAETLHLYDGDYGKHDTRYYKEE